MLAPHRRLRRFKLGTNGPGRRDKALGTSYKLGGPQSAALTGRHLLET